MINLLKLTLTLIIFNIMCIIFIKGKVLSVNGNLKDLVILTCPKEEKVVIKGMVPKNEVFS